VLLSHCVRGLTVTDMMVLLGMMWVVILVLKLLHLHCESLMCLTAIHHGMLPLVILTVHSVRIQGNGLVEGRRP
jgi:hypothetical protein